MSNNPGGRPTVMTPEIINKLEEAFANGATDLQACFYAGISHQTLYNYQKANPEFIERKNGLKNHLQLIAKNVLAKSIRSGNELDAKWLLERKEKGDYSLRNEHTGANGGAQEHDVRINDVSDIKAKILRAIPDDQLTAILAGNNDRGSDTGSA